MDITCAVCGASPHHALCPVPIVSANPQRSGVTEIAVSDWADLVVADPSRDRVTEILGLVLNWGIRKGQVSLIETAIEQADVTAKKKASKAKARGK